MMKLSAVAQSVAGRALSSQPVRGWFSLAHLAHSLRPPPPSHSQQLLQSVPCGSRQRPKSLIPLITFTTSWKTVGGADTLSPRVRECRVSEPQNRSKYEAPGKLLCGVLASGDCS